MKKYFKPTILTVLIIVSFIISLVYLKNKNINNQPKKAKLVINLSHEMEENFYG